MRAEEIINLYKDEYGYVSDIKDLTRFLKENDDIDIKERNLIIAKVIEWNLSVERENREKLEETKSRQIQVITDETKKEEEENIETKSSLTDVDSYISAIKKCDDDDFLTEILPSIYDANYESIIGSILLYFLREISLANEMLELESNKDDIEYLRRDIKRDKEIIKIIKDYNNDEEEEINEENIQSSEEVNKLVFLRKLNNSLYIDDDIDEIALEDDVLPILNDIITGKITKEKRFHNSNELKGISAIRRRDSRIIFVRLDNNVILILGVLVKRFQNPQSYRDMLDSRVKCYKLQKEELKEKINQEDFMLENEQIKERIIESLKSRKRLIKGE